MEIQHARLMGYSNRSPNKKDLKKKKPIFIPQVVSRRTKKLKFNGKKKIKITVDINKKTKIEKISKSKSQFTEKRTKLTNLC